MALVWLRIYPTYELLGWLFGLEKSNAWKNVQDALAVLGTLADFPFERPAATATSSPPRPRSSPRSRRSSHHRRQGAAVPTPEGWDQQKPYYSGKKKPHTVKTQVVCTPAGRIEGVSETVPAPPTT